MITHIRSQITESEIKCALRPLYVHVRRVSHDGGSVCGEGGALVDLVDSFPMQWGAVHWTLPLYIRVCSLGCPFLHHCMHRLSTYKINP